MAETIRVLTSDALYFNVPQEIARLSPTLANILDDTKENHPDAIKLYEVNSNALKLVVDWLIKHKNDEKVKKTAGFSGKQPTLRNDQISNWDKKFLRRQDPGTLFELTMAASHLEIDYLTEITVNRVFELMKPDQTPEQIRENLGIPTSDLTNEEIAQIQNENEWILGINNTS